jgi:hypothetical protein
MNNFLSNVNFVMNTTIFPKVSLRPLRNNPKWSNLRPNNNPRENDSQEDKVLKLVRPLILKELPSIQIQFPLWNLVRMSPPLRISLRSYQRRKQIRKKTLPPLLKSHLGRV